MTERTRTPDAAATKPLADLVITVTSFDSRRTIERLLQSVDGLAARIARFQNCYGPEGTWDGGREKAPAALSRKVAQSTDGTIEVWGDGTAVRSFVYVDDLVDGIRRLMDSDEDRPTNIGTRQYVAVRELVDLVAQAAGKAITPRWVPGPVGVQSRNFSNDRIENLGYQPAHDLAAGLAKTYPWINEQVQRRG